MGFKAKVSERKRDREKIKGEKYRLKQLRRLEAKEHKTREKERRRQALLERKARASGNGAEDPDIAGIAPGPQSLPEQWNSAY